MAFLFPLEAVFHFRQSVEHQQELRLRSANQQVSRVRHLIDQLDLHIHQMHSHQSQELGTGTTAAELRFSLLCETSAREHRQGLQRELVRLENLRDQQQTIFRQARRDRETFESLRDHQFRDYERDATRREQRQQDDLFLMRQTYLKRR